MFAKVKTHFSLDHILLAAAVFMVTFVSLEMYFIQTSPTKASEVIVEVSPPQSYLHDRLYNLENWERPAGPWHVALQIGHLNATDAPDELGRIRKNTGTQHESVTEVAAMQEIADNLKSYLESYGINVTIHPTTIPENFWADVAVSLHADGNLDSSVSGFKVSHSWSDHTGKGPRLSSALEEAYGEATGLRRDPSVSWNMRRYYAFDWRRFDHSFHPMTVSAIVETGFLTNATDRRVIVDAPSTSAEGIANGIITFLTENVPQ